MTKAEPSDIHIVETTPIFKVEIKLNSIGDILVDCFQLRNEDVIKSLSSTDVEKAIAEQIIAINSYMRTAFECINNDISKLTGAVSREAESDAQSDEQTPTESDDGEGSN